MNPARDGRFDSPVLHDGVHRREDIRLPADPGGHQRGARRHLGHALVPADKPDRPLRRRFFTGNRRADGVGVLRKHHTALVDQPLCCRLFLRIAAPGSRIAHAHHRLRHHRAHPQHECGVTRDDLGRRKGGHKADKSLVLRDQAVRDHLFDLHARGDAAHIAPLIGLALEAVIVGRHRFAAHVHVGRLTELDVRILLRQLHHQLAVAVEEQNVAALFGQLTDRLLDFLIQHVAAGENVHPVPVFLFHRVLRKREVVGIGRALIVVIEKADGQMLAPAAQVQKPEAAENEHRDDEAGQRRRQIHSLHDSRSFPGGGVRSRLSAFFR